MENVSDMSNSDLRALLIQRYNEHVNYDDWQEMTTSETNWDGADDTAIRMKAWRRPALTPTGLCLKMHLVFPKWDVE